MKPKVVQIDPQNIDLEELKHAAEVINNRGLVAFPTETVYGLGADALDSKAATSIFEAKKRPLDDPLIVHIAEKDDLYRLVQEVPHEVEKLIERFWPGPLTVILKKTDLVPDIVTTGLDTVAVRMPSNPIARKFISLCGTPLAAPSANLFGRPSPTTAKHVVDDLNGSIDLVIDGGSSEIGVESTVIEFDEGKTIVLRPGGINLEDIKLFVGDIELAEETGHIERSPGKYPQHYSPKAEVVLVENSSDQVEEVLTAAYRLEQEGNKIGILSTREHEDSFRAFCVKVLGPQKDGKICASRLFHMLREFDVDEVNVIVAEGIPEDGLGYAVMNRLRKAAGPDLY